MSESDRTAARCARCGRPTAASGGLCETCLAELASGATQLAPPPADDAATVLGTPPVESPDDGSTVLVNQPPTSNDADATRLTPLPPLADPASTVLAETPAPRGTGTSRIPRGTGAASGGALAAGDTFGRYTIVRLLGMGGMGAVYQAWDKELEVVVALKVIRPEVMADPIAEQEIEKRFKRELLLARQVTHKNVVRIYDLGEIEGIKYITMSYVDGQELDALMKESGRLPIPTTLRIMKSVVSGLVAAHAAGVIHRDLKPANIMIRRDGEALIMDFGIARSAGAPSEVKPADSSGSAGPSEVGTGTSRFTQATVVGSIVGTVEYMAPEQARGGAIDHRADIYTFGLILYDMLVGARRPEHKSGVMEQLRIRMQGEVPPIQSLAPDVPDGLAAVVSRAIDPDPDKRFQTTPELAAALDRLDENGVPKPIRRVVGLPLAAAAALLLSLVSVGVWWYGRQNAPVRTPDPVSVVIADFENRTGEPTFDRTLEPTLRRALEGAGFITAYDRVGLRRTVNVAVPEKLDEAAAREVAVKQGLTLVLSGAVEKQGSRYRITMKVTQAVEGTVMTDVSGRASSADDVIPAATRLVGDVREALGDQTTETDPIFAQRSLSASSPEVLRYYAAAQNASANNKWDEAQKHLLKAIEVDPNFGLGYLLLSGVSRNMGNVQAANEYVKQAMSHVDSMTNRERLTTRGMYFRLTGDYESCKKEQEDLIKAYAADVVGRNQLSVCASQMRDFKLARESILEVVRLLPKRSLFRDNLALYSNYLSDFAEAEAQARIVLEQVPAGEPFALLALGMSQLGQDRPKEAVETFTTLATVKPLGPTFSPSGLADVAVYEGRFNDAVRITEQGAAADIAAKSPDRAAAKLLHQAYANLLKGQKPAAVASAQRALGLSQVVKVRFLAARVFIEAGKPELAAPLVAELLAGAQPEPKAHGRLLESMSARLRNDHAAAIKAAEEANTLLDTWIGHFELGRAYFAARQYTQADAEFDRCYSRRGEALSLFVDEEPTYGYFPAVYFYQGLVREGMNLSGADKFREYLKIREAAGEDPLIADLRRRISK